jgi:hypothetical protein
MGTRVRIVISNRIKKSRLIWFGFGDGVRVCYDLEKSPLV